MKNFFFFHYRYLVEVKNDTGTAACNSCFNFLETYL